MSDLRTVDGYLYRMKERIGENTLILCTYLLIVYMMLSKSRGRRKS